MFGIPLDGPANLFFDNESVFKNENKSESKLKKKHQSFFFYMVRGCVASGILIPHKVDFNNNIDDLLTNSLVSEKLIVLLSKITF